MPFCPPSPPPHSLTRLRGKECVGSPRCPVGHRGEGEGRRGDNGEDDRINRGPKDHRPGGNAVLLPSS
jgi:hypothetical protein